MCAFVKSPEGKSVSGFVASASAKVGEVVTVKYSDKGALVESTGLCTAVLEGSGGNDYFSDEVFGVDA